METSRSLLEMAVKREKLRKESLLLDHVIFEQRILAREMTNRLGIPIDVIEEAKAQRVGFSCYYFTDMVETCSQTSWHWLTVPIQVSSFRVVVVELTRLDLIAALSVNERLPSSMRTKYQRIPLLALLKVTFTNENLQTLVGKI